MKKTLIAVMTAAALCGAFVWLPSVRGQNGPAAPRGTNAATDSHAQGAHDRDAKHAPQASPPLKIALVDFQVVLRDYKKAADKVTEMKASLEAGNARIQQISGEMQAIAKSVQEAKIEQDSDEYRTSEKKLYQLDTSRKTYKASAERDMKIQGAKVSLTVYQDLQEALKLFCDKSGYTLVLQIDREIAAAKDYRMFQQTAAQPIIYHRSHDDITLAVISYLNHRYEAERGDEATEESTSGTLPAEPTRSIPVSPNRKPAAR